MRVAVYDTYVVRKDGRMMNFDILVPEGFEDTEAIYEFGRRYLEGKGEDATELRTEKCNFCHIEEADDSTLTAIESDGHAIVEIENCD